jgi:hypothetical protein
VGLALLMVALTARALCAPPQAPTASAPITAADEQERAAPSARKAVGGLAGLAVVSKLSAADPAGARLESELQVWFVFPDRARWQRTPLGAPAGQRELLYRFGANTWRLAPGEAVSRTLEGDEALAVELELELRRALWLWPDGFAWQGEGARRSAPLSVPASSDGARLWFLVARLGEDGRPLEMGLAEGSADGDARARASFRSLSWNAQGGRHFPTACDFFRGDQRQWSEAVSATYQAPQALDHFFLPPDRKPVDLPILASAPREVRLPARATRRIALVEQTTWSDALATARRCADEERDELDRLGLELDAALTLELDSDGTPRAVLLEITKVPATLPVGWTTVPERAGWDLRLPGQGPVPKEYLTQLRARLSGNDTPDSARVRIAPDSRGRPVLQVVLPYERGAL